MKDKEKRKGQKRPPAQKLDEGNAQAPTLAPPQFKLATDEPVQKKDDKKKEKAKNPVPNPNAQGPASTSGNGNSAGTTGLQNLLPDALAPIPNFHLNPPDPLNGMDPDVLRQMQLMQSLRRRTPLVGGLLSEEQLLNLWYTPPGTTYEWSNGESGSMYDLYSDEQMDEQMLMGRILQERYPTLPGWEWGMNDMGAGGTWTFGNGSELNLGLMPYFGEDDTAQFPWMLEDEDAPLIQGGTAGFQYRW